MKARGRHKEKALSALTVKQPRAPGRYTDGNGLYLVVDPSGAKRWLLRVVVQGRRRDIGLGSATLVSLSEAREKAIEYRKVARGGGDPLAARKQVAKATPTFRDAAERVHAEQEVTWRNAKHAQQWLTTLKRYAFPIIGDYRVDAIGTPEVLRVLSPIWLTKQETARRVRQRIGTVMDWAKASGFRSGDNPVEGVDRGLPKQGRRDSHHAAMAFAEVPGFVAKLKASASSEAAKLAFKFLILTASRTGEVLYATWDEIDLSEKLWMVPADRMKAKRIHRVPLSPRAIEVLTHARGLYDGEGYLFPGKDPTKPLSNMVFLEILKRMDLKVTAHGFRSALRDWAAESTSYPREIAEMALAHTIESKVEAAYRRGDLLEKRRSMMEDWASFVCNVEPQRDAKPTTQ